MMAHSPLPLAAELADRLAAIPSLDASASTLAELRQRAGLASASGNDARRWRDVIVRAEPELQVRIHRPRRPSTRPAPVILGMHGGGFVFGSRSAQDDRFARWCGRFDCVGVSVEYRLAPEAAYPAALDDCYAALAWIFAHAAELNGDLSRVGVYGPSAGGGLAAGLALLARDRAEYPVAFQILEAAMLDDRQQTASSQAPEQAIWTPASTTFGWQSYLGDRYGQDDVPAYAAPGRCRDFTGLPPALVVVGGADGFRDENIAYASRLAAAGVLTDLHVLAGAPHGVQAFSDSLLMERWNRVVDDWLAGVLAPQDGPD
jgi:acetyl esterase/lipase